MILYNKLFMASILCFSLFSPPVFPSDQSKDLYAQLIDASQNGHYVAPTAQELTQAEILFNALFKGKNNKAIQHQWEKLGFKLLVHTQQGETRLLLREKQNQGRGFYVFRMTKGHALAAPHAFHDLKTREIVLDLFLKGEFQAAAWNTVHRQQVDLGKTSNSFMMAFSRAFVATHPKDYLVQVHGFAQSKRKTSAAVKANIILSSGDRYPSVIAQQIARCLQHNVDSEVRLSFIDVFELGGTQNIIGQWFKRQQHNGFIHLELSFTFRQALLRNNDLFMKFVECFSI